MEPKPEYSQHLQHPGSICYAYAGLHNQKEQQHPAFNIPAQQTPHKFTHQHPQHIH